MSQLISMPRRSRGRFISINREQIQVRAYWNPSIPERKHHSREVQGLLRMQEMKYKCNGHKFHDTALNGRHDKDFSWDPKLRRSLREWIIHNVTVIAQRCSSTPIAPLFRVGIIVLPSNFIRNLRCSDPREQAYLCDLVNCRMMYCRCEEEQEN